MILRGIEVENWRCIEHVRLVDLPLGVVVIHGPNGIGKSSLFEAVRCCLFDFDHDTGHKRVRNAVPRRTKATPKIIVDFETGGTRYRITKVFARTKEGTACLERRTDGEWRMAERGPKEASRRVRELLEAEKSDTGLNQLLWVEQGQVSLPKGDLNEPLEKHLESVLGTLVTGRDLDFRTRLEGACGRWFTSGMRHRRGRKNQSPVLALRERRDQCEEELKGIEDRLRVAERLVKDFDKTKAKIGRLHQQVDEANSEYRKIEIERDATRERLNAHRQAVRDHEKAGDHLTRCQKALKDYEDARESLAKQREAFGKAKDAAAEARREADERLKDVRKAEDALREARSKEDEHARQRQDIEAHQRLVEIRDDFEELDRTTKDIGQLQKGIAASEEELAGPVAPSEDAVRRLRGQANEIQRLRNELDAAGLYVGFEPDAEASVTVARDNEQPVTVDLEPGTPGRWQARQRISLAIRDVGRIEVGRRQEDRDLEEAASRLKSLIEEYAQAVRSWQEDPDDADALDRLTRRRVDREHLTKALADLKKRLQALAPEGTAALQSKRERLEHARQEILARFPHLEDWKPDEDEVHRIRTAFDAETKHLTGARKEAEGKAERLRGEWADTDRQAQDAQNVVVGLEATCNQIEQQLARMGDYEALKRDAAQAKQKAKAAEAKVQKTALTDEEATVGERLKQAGAALTKRQERLHDAEGTLNQLRGELRATEGLHTERVRIEQERNAVVQELAHEELQAEAHALLITLFDRCRDRQVHRTMGPIAGRVLDWAHHLGLDEYNAIAFGDDFLPAGLVSHDAGPDEEPVPFADESYGTEEQLALVTRLALGAALARDEPEVAILDDPLAHSDPSRHRRMLDILRWAAEGTASAKGETRKPGRLQVFILTCHPERFDYLSGARQIDFTQADAHHESRGADRPASA